MCRPEKPPNWRPVLLRGDGAADLRPRGDRLYRAAALSLATDDELTGCPGGLTWFDLRVDEERARDRVRPLPPGWRIVSFPLAGADAAFDRRQAAASVAEIAAGRASWGSLYRAALTRAPASFAGALRALAAIPGPVVIACQGGRDRTGMLVALLLALAGASREQIVADYLRTNQDRSETQRRQPPDGTLAAPDLTCLASDIEDVLDLLDEFGGAHAYLGRVLPADEVTAIARALRPRLLP
ncbi:tyrosine-protein phosphatase [Allonocardiopsis opalescens]|uniref:Tyrosine phosphatase family protein n=1 Tax=Allonocardiopsis opalescens TaxID=1144618 RepID=A0A2T0Q9I6_9ACTN|nr:tyrosine-protein phosphatase [Allonocardiopsis opalescens]PRY00470.1 tyrosine phosphatase family protein [Allonocardiopsis opalescens]